MTATNERDRYARASLLFNQDQALDWNQALAAADEQLAREAGERAESEAKMRTYDESYLGWQRCAACGATRANHPRYALCEQCLYLVPVLEAQRRAHDQIDGTSRADRVRDYLERQAR